MFLVVPFIVKDCTLSTIATGQFAASLPEFIDKLAHIPLSSIYYHFWGGRMRFSFETIEYQNDFAIWAKKVVQDPILAEKLAVVDPTEYDDLETLKQNLIDIVESHLDQIDYVIWEKTEHRFHFLRSLIVIFQTPWSAREPKEFKSFIRILSPGAIFYHFIDARRRTEKKEDDFSSWLREFSLPQIEAALRDLHSIDPYFLSLLDIKEKIALIMEKHFS
jgi:hypothetical protein